MTYEYQIRVLPQQAANEATLREFISRDKGLDARTINHVRVLKKSIDARHRTIYVNLKVRVYVNEFPQDDEYERVEYCDVSDKPRHNERCQNTLMPKWYRKHMTEHQV